MNWQKSTYSYANTNCVEVAIDFRKSSFSGPDADCVEVANHPGMVHVRDSKLGEDSLVLDFTPSAWKAFLEGVKTGELG